MRIIIYFYLLFIIGAHCKYARIIGGKDTDIQEFPHIVAIKRIDTNAIVCAGAIISNKHILTAGHCIYEKERYFSSLRIFSSATDLSEANRPVYHIDRFFVHSGFEGRIVGSSNWHNDISVLKIKETIVFNEYQNKIDLPTEDIDSICDVVLAGWGVTNSPTGYFSNKLKSVVVRTVDPNECMKVFPHPVREDQICTYAAGKGAATGDSGGPVTKDGKLIGIISFSIPWLKMLPQIHCNVYKHLDFIRNSMKR